MYLPKAILRYLSLAIVVMITSSHAHAWACGLCITPRGGLSALHPKSLAVAIAIRRDIDAGLLTHKQDKPEEKAVRHDRDLQTGRILVERLSLRHGFELLLIEDGSHFRIEGIAELRRRNQPTAPSVRWVTGRDVMVALLERRLKLETAISRGLIVVEDAAVEQAATAFIP
jgi:hypothetical protein